MGNKMSTMNMVILLLGVVLSVFVGFAWMAYCFRYQPVIGVVALFCRACLLCPCSPRPRPRRARRSLATLPRGPSQTPSAASTHSLLFGHSELPRLEHGVPRRGPHVCGRGGIHSICPERSLLQVSRSTQKLLPVPKVSEQKTDQR